MVMPESDWPREDEEEVEGRPSLLTFENIGLFKRTIGSLASSVDEQIMGMCDKLMYGSSRHGIPSNSVYSPTSDVSSDGTISGDLQNIIADDVRQSMDELRLTAPVGSSFLAPAMSELVSSSSYYTSNRYDINSTHVPAEDSTHVPAEEVVRIAGGETFIRGDIESAREAVERMTRKKKSEDLLEEKPKKKQLRAIKL